jgi:putative zinc finger/helix-turn-helix YgiT family protein
MQTRKTRLKEDPSSCPKCSSSAIEAYSYTDTVDFRNLELDVEKLESCRCTSCGSRWETRSQAEGNQARIKEEYAKVRDHIRERDGLLPGNRLSEIRKQLSMNQKEASVLFGGGTNSFNKYESGEVLQSFAMDRLVRLTGAIGQSAVEFLRDVDAPHPFNVDLLISSTAYFALSTRINISESLTAALRLANIGSPHFLEVSIPSPQSDIRQTVLMSGHPSQITKEVPSSFRHQYAFT